MKFGARGAHILVPKELIGKEVEILLVGEEVTKEPETPEPKEELNTFVQEPKKEPSDDYNSLMVKLMQSHPQH